MTTEGVPGARHQDSPTRDAVAALALPLPWWWTYHLWGLWPTKLSAGGQVHFSVVSVSSPSLWTCCELPQSLARWELPDYFGLFLCWHQRNLEEVLGAGGGTWRSLPSPSKTMSLGRTKAEQHIAFHYQTVITSSKTCPATLTLPSLQVAVLGRPQSVVLSADRQ